MKWAELALGYVDALAWPLVVAAAVFVFRRQIASKIGDLKEATTPVGGATFFDREAKAVEKRAEKAAERQQNRTGHAPSSKGESLDDAQADGGESGRAEETKTPDRRAAEADFVAITLAWVQLDLPRDFEVARTIAADSPRAAVMLAFSELEVVARAAWTLTNLGDSGGPPSAARAIRSLIGSSGLTSEFEPVVNSLVELRNRVAHGGAEAAEVSTDGAIDFVGACEQLAEALRSVSLSKFRHPSRSPKTKEWAEWLESSGYLDEDDETSD